LSNKKGSDGSGIITTIVIMVIIGFFMNHPIILIFIFLFLIVIIIAKSSQKRKAEKEAKRQAEQERLILEEQERRVREARLQRELQEQQMRVQREEQMRQEIARREEERRKQEEEEKILRQKFKNTVDSLPSFDIVLSGEKHKRNKQIDIEDMKYKTVTKKSSLKNLKDFVAFDTETTGLSTKGNDIIQLSAIKYKDFKPVEKFDTYIKPRKPIPYSATEINGITDEMVEFAPEFWQIINSFNEFIGDLPLVAHNAPFDVKHLYVNGFDLISEKKVYDTLALSRNTFEYADNYKLSYICEYLGIYMSDAHNSVYDSFAVGELFIKIIARRRDITSKELLEIVSEEENDIENY